MNSSYKCVELENVFFLSTDKFVEIWRKFQEFYTEFINSCVSNSSNGFHYVFWTWNDKSLFSSFLSNKMYENSENEWRSAHHQKIIDLRKSLKIIADLFNASYIFDTTKTRRIIKTENLEKIWWNTNRSPQRKIKSLSPRFSTIHLKTRPRPTIVTQPSRKTTPHPRFRSPSKVKKQRRFFRSERPGMDKAARKGSRVENFCERAMPVAHKRHGEQRGKRRDEPPKVPGFQRALELASTATRPNEGRHLTACCFYYRAVPEP